jgi:hypothetical protein
MNGIEESYKKDIFSEKEVEGIKSIVDKFGDAYSKIAIPLVAHKEAEAKKEFLESRDMLKKLAIAW